MIALIVPVDGLVLMVARAVNHRATLAATKILVREAASNATLVNFKRAMAILAQAVRSVRLEATAFVERPRLLVVLLDSMAALLV